MEELIKIYRTLSLRAPGLLAYGSVLYYLEIIYLMIALSFFYGKPVALIIGGLATLLLSLHIVRFYSRSPRSRTVQLALMEIHGAYSIPFLAGVLFQGFHGTPLDSLFIINRLALACMDLAGILLLTDEGMKHRFGRQAGVQP